MIQPETYYCERHEKWGRPAICPGCLTEGWHDEAQKLAYDLRDAKAESREQAQAFTAVLFVLLALVVMLSLQGCAAARHVETELAAGGLKARAYGAAVLP